MLLGIFMTYLCQGVTYAQPTVSIASNADAQISFANSGTNYGSLNTSNISVVSSTDYFRSLYWFNFSGIPSTAVVVSAKLQLTPSAAGEGGAGASSFIVQGITGTWTEAGVKFSNIPATTSTNQQIVSSLSSGKREFDVTAMIQSHLSGTLPLTGVMVKRNSETTVATPCQYHTKEATTSTNRPALVISWYDPVRITAATITKTTGTATTDGAVSITATGGSHSGGAASLTYQWYNASGTISGATTTAISSKAAGCYGIVINSAYSPVYSMMFPIGTQCTQVTMDLLKDPLFVDDAQVFKSAGTTNYGSVDQLTSGNTSTSSLNIYQMFLRYRLWYDAQYDIYSATQTLVGKAHSTQANAANLYRTTADWAETAVTFNNKPTFDNTTPAGVYSAATTSATQNRVFVVTDFFRYWDNNSNSTFGYTLVSTIPSGTIGYQNFYSSDATTAANRPNVNIVLDDATCDRQAFVAFKKELDGGYVNTIQKKLKFYFTEEYQIQANMKVPLMLLDENNAIVAAIDINGGAISGKPLLPAFPYAFDDNRFTLDLTSYSLTAGKFYVLQLTRSNGEKAFIKFQYSN